MDIQLNEITSNDYKKILHDNRYIVINFYADWFNPCKITSRILSSIIDEYKGRVSFYGLNADKEDELATRINVHSVPTLIFIYQSKIVSRTPGLMSKQQIINRIERMMKY